MNMQSIGNLRPETQEPLRIPTPTEISIALNTVLFEDSKDPQTPPIPAHIGGLIREAIKRANAGEFK